MAELIRAHHWSATSLGPIADWPQSLRTVVDLMLATAQPVYIGWGPELISLYNDGYIPIAGAKQPDSLGLPYREMWPEIWDDFRPVAAAVMAGEPQYFVDQPVALAGRSDRPISWFTFSWTPLRAEDGTVGGFYCVATETTERVLAEQALATDYRRLFDSMDQGYLLADVIFDADGRATDIAYLEANPAATRMVGTDLTGKRLREVSPDYEEYWYEIWGRVARTGQGERLERYASPEGRWYDFHVFKADPQNTASHRIAVMFQDVTTRKKAEVLLRESEERQAFLLRLSDALRPLNDEGEIERTATRLLGEHLQADRCFLSPVYDDGSGMCVREEYLRSGASSVLGDYTFAQFGDFVGPELHAGHILAVEDVGVLDGLSGDARESYVTVGIGAYLLIPLVRGGRLAAFLTINHQTPRPWSEADKAVARQTADRLWSARERARVETALRESEGRLQVLVAELQHRVRNILTVIRSVFGRTMAAGGDVEQVADHFRGRLDALARTQVGVTQSASGLVDLENLIRDELLSVSASDGPDLVIAGPDVALEPKAAETIGLAIHELTTNAIKYGALRGTGGQLRIEWATNLVKQGNRQLVLTWTEQGVPAVPLQPVRYGFGSELIQEALPYRLGAETRLEFRGGGVRCTISMPLSGRQIVVGNP